MKNRPKNDAKCLVLVRHGKAEAATTGENDWDRDLAKRGERDAALMGEHLKERHVKPDLVIASPAVRAARTAEIVCKVLKVGKGAIVMEERLYLASAAQYLKIIRHLDGDPRTVMLFGHNPGLGELADQLATERRIDHLPTCGVVIARFKIKRWSELAPGTALELDFDYPKNA